MEFIPQWPLQSRKFVNLDNPDSEEYSLALMPKNPPVLQTRPAKIQQQSRTKAVSIHIVLRLR